MTTVLPDSQWLHVPELLLCHIITFLDPKQICQSEPLSKSWQRACRNERLVWKPICHAHNLVANNNSETPSFRETAIRYAQCFPFAQRLDNWIIPTVREGFFTSGWGKKSDINLEDFPHKHENGIYTYTSRDTRQGGRGIADLEPTEHVSTTSQTVLTIDAFMELIFSNKSEFFKFRSLGDIDPDNVEESFFADYYPKRAYNRWKNVDMDGAQQFMNGMFMPENDGGLYYGLHCINSREFDRTTFRVSEENEAAYMNSVRELMKTFFAACGEENGQYFIAAHVLGFDIQLERDEVIVGVYGDIICVLFVIFGRCYG